MCAKSRPSLVIAAVLMLTPTLAWAQSSIVGQVRDESGGVLPGVAVTAASPALIEQSRTAVTDDQGRYRVDALRPGTPTNLRFLCRVFQRSRAKGLQCRPISR